MAALEVEPVHRTEVETGALENLGSVAQVFRPLHAVDIPGLVLEELLVTAHEESRRHLSTDHSHLADTRGSRRGESRLAGRWRQARCRHTAV